MSDQIVIIAIDETSIQQLGRWPWSRLRYAELLDRLTPMYPRAIGIDILFSESEATSNVDAEFAKSLERNSRSILAVAPVQQTPNALITELLPIPLLASSAAAIGHVDAELDIDGLSRHFYLYGGLEDPHWRSIALAMLEIGEVETPVFNDSNSSKINTFLTGTGWVREHKALIPFSKYNDQPKHISFADILAGRVPAEAIHDKYVLIGATAAGLGDRISTPTYQSHQRMSGVELVAQELNGLLQNKLIYNLPYQHQLALTLLLIISGVVTIYILPLRLGLATTLATTFFIITCSLYLLVFQKLWFAPATALLMVIISWPLWSLWQHYISEQLIKTLTGQLEEQSRYNLITGLPNNGMLQEWLYKLKQFDTNSNLTALFIVHIKWPESAASMIGRSMGDLILQTISVRLKLALKTTPFIAHLSNDDFALLITEQQDIITIHRTASRILEHLKKPLNHFGEEVVLAPNIGISIWPTDSQDSTDLLRKAYTAMFKSHMDDNQPICIYSADIGQEIEARADIERAMSYALERNEFEVYYQPQVEAVTGKLIGAEALLRWYNPKLGLISPDTFIPVAEQSGMINVIGDWVLKTACNDLKNILQLGLDPIRIAVNLSPLQFSDMNLAENIATTIFQAGIAPNFLELEVTESTLMNNISIAFTAMEKIKQNGFSLAIDDFGTGYSSLQHLQNFPLDRLKIDKCFTQDLANKNTSEITLSIIALAKRLNLGVIAEGVETIAQAEFLRDNGCDELQGYLYSRPIPIDELIGFMRAEISE
tara:strand:+ start:28530 stop:30842 length:2313 start_codon:yes stop_codon:yes gene_type:complete